jgi:hypothetical protein
MRRAKPTTLHTPAPYLPLLRATRPVRGREALGREALLGAGFKLCRRFITRRQAVLHSCLLMWVPASQKPMQASKLSPPPPGMLGADSLGLLLPGAGDPPPPGKVAVVADVVGAVVLSPPGVVTVVVPPPGVVTVVPPLPRKVEVVGGESGATGGT